jgi:hypothetical protein
MQKYGMTKYRCPFLQNLLIPDRITTQSYFMQNGSFLLPISSKIVFSRQKRIQYDFILIKITIFVPEYKRQKNKKIWDYLRQRVLTLFWQRHQRSTE